MALAEEGGNDEENQGSRGDEVQHDAPHYPIFDHSKIKGALKDQCSHRVTRKVTLSSPVFGPPFTPYLIFQWYPQSKDILLMKCCNSVRNAETQYLMHKVRE